MPVRIVVDSLADIPSAQIEKHHIQVVPLTIRFGSLEFKDGVDLTAEDFYRRLLSDNNFPSTAVPSVGDFVDVYERIGKDADGIISIHVSSQVSGTHNAAVQGAREAKLDCPIEIVDSMQASMGIGMLALVAANAAEENADFSTILEGVRNAMTRVTCTSLLDTLEYLQKGGRIGKAQALVGTLLNFKPMIEVVDGAVAPYARPRSRKKGIDRLVERALELAPVERLAILYSTTEDDALQLGNRLSDLLGVEAIVSRYGPGLGTHVGPGALGIAVLTSAGK